MFGKEQDLAYLRTWVPSVTWTYETVERPV